MHQEFLLARGSAGATLAERINNLALPLIILHLLRAKCNLLDHKFYLRKSKLHNLNGHLLLMMAYQEQAADGKVLLMVENMQVQLIGELV